MSWSLYTTLTARNRAIEAMVAMFALIWAIVVAALQTANAEGDANGSSTNSASV